MISIEWHRENLEQFLRERDNPLPVKTVLVGKAGTPLSGCHPSLGESFDPLAIQFERPYAFYARLRQEEPITFSPAVNAYLVSRYDEIRAVLSQPELFSSRNALGSFVEFYPQTISELQKGYPIAPSMLTADGARHSRLREPVQKALSPIRVRAMEPLIRQITTKLINTFIEDEQIEIISQFAYRLPLEVIFTILGIPQQDMEMVKQHTDALGMLLVLPLSPEQQLECARQAVALQHYYAHLIEQRRLYPSSDLISDLIRNSMAQEEPLSDADLINQINDVVIAGHEATTHLIGSGLVLLLEEPTRWHALCEHPESIPLAIEEILRLRGPAQGFIRTASQQVTVGGVTMPEGTNLLLLYASANLDEGSFPHVCEFQMSRHPNHHLAFGYGAHFCPGAPLARLEGRIAFEALTQRIPNMVPLPDQQFEYNLVFNTYGHKSIYIQKEIK